MHVWELVRLFFTLCKLKQFNQRIFDDEFIVLSSVMSVWGKYLDEFSYRFFKNDILVTVIVKNNRDRYFLFKQWFPEVKHDQVVRNFKFDPRSFFPQLLLYELFKANVSLGLQVPNCLSSRKLMKASGRDYIANYTRHYGSEIESRRSGFSGTFSSRKPDSVSAIPKWAGRHFLAWVIFKSGNANI